MIDLTTTHLNAEKETNLSKLEDKAAGLLLNGLIAAAEEGKTELLLEWSEAYKALQSGAAERLNKGSKWLTPYYQSSSDKTYGNIISGCSCEGCNE